MHNAEWQLNEDQIGSLSLEAKIGEGSYGKVYRARLPGTSTLYAVKVVEIDVEQEDLARLKETPGYKTMEQEISILKTCQYVPQIVRVFGVGVNFAEDLKAKVMVVMELCEHGSVSDILRRMQEGLRESEIRVIAREVLHGLKYLHGDKKIHRDVKAGNILLTRRFCPKLADFGISCELQNTFAKRDTVIGSPYWMAPEVIKAGFGYNSRADIWSLGITCVEMAELQPPYFHISPTRAMFVICTKPPTGLCNPEVQKAASPEFTAFISSCLAVDPKERPAAPALLVDPFVRRRGVGEPPPSDSLEATLGHRLAEANAAIRDQQAPQVAAGRSSSGSLPWQQQRRSPGGTLVGALPRPSGGTGNASAGIKGQQPAAPSLEAATPSVDAFASATLVLTGGGAASGMVPSRGSPASPGPAVRGGAASTMPWRPSAASADTRSPDSCHEDDDEDDDGPLDPEEIRRRAREWVNRTVPMPPLEDFVADSSPGSVIAAPSPPAQHLRVPGPPLLPRVAVAAKSAGDVWDSDEEGVVTRTRLEAQPEAGAGGPGGSVPFFMQVLNKQWG